MHGVAWLQDAPDVEMLLATDDHLKLLDATENITAYVRRSPGNYYKSRYSC